MENIRKITKNRILFVICTIMLAAICIAPFGFKPHNAYAACSHSWRDYRVIKQPTCTQMGSKQQRCSKCKAFRTINSQSLGHVSSNYYVVARNATCGSAGQKVMKCKRCSLVISTVTIPATGNHNWRENKVFQRPTCTTNGSTQMICTGCGQTKLTYYPMLGHTSSGSYWQTLSKATCSEPERQGLKCSRCGTVISWKYVGELAHDWVKNYYDEIEDKVYDYCKKCNARKNIKKVTADNVPINGTLRSYEVKKSLTGAWGTMKFEGEINPKNYISDQYLRLRSDYVEGPLKLTPEQKAANLTEDGIKIRFKDDGTAEAYLKYITNEDKVYEEVTGEYGDLWKLYAYVKYNEDKITFYPVKNGFEAAELGNGSDVNIVVLKLK